MAVLDVVKFPDPRLRAACRDVVEVDAAVRELVRDMIETMYALDAAGIAAIQVGRCERIFVIDGKVATDDEQAEPLVFINPEVVETSGGEELADEGCLSFPDVFVEIKRPRRAKVRALDVDGQLFEAEGEGLFGRALQHEYDHLNGKLMYDLVGVVKKEMIKRKMKRWHTAHETDPLAT
ncbi:MAG: peptide deformylase [Nannocystaceae bacterium]